MLKAKFPTLAGLLVTSIIGAVFAVTLATTPSSAQGAQSAEIETLVRASASALDIEVSDPELVAMLTETVAFAADQGIVSDAIMDSLVSTEGSQVFDGLESEIRANLDLQLENWEQEARDLNAAYVFFKDDFEACRASGTKSPVACAEELGLMLQMKSAMCTVDKIEAFEQMLVDLEGEDLTQNEREIELSKALLEKKLARALDVLERSEPGSSKEADAREIITFIEAYLASN